MLIWKAGVWQEELRDGEQVVAGAPLFREASTGAAACGTNLAMHILYAGRESYLKINLFTDIIKL